MNFTTASRPVHTPVHNPLMSLPTFTTHWTSKLHSLHPSLPYTPLPYPIDPNTTLPTTTFASTLTFCENAFEYLAWFRHDTLVHDVDVLHPMDGPGTAEQRLKLWRLALLGRKIRDIVVEAANLFWGAKCSYPMRFPGREPLRWLETEWEDRGRMWAVMYAARGELEGDIPGL